MVIMVCVQEAIIQLLCILTAFGCCQKSSKIGSPCNKAMASLQLHKKGIDCVFSEAFQFHPKTINVGIVQL